MQKALFRKCVWNQKLELSPGWILIQKRLATIACLYLSPLLRMPEECRRQRSLCRVELYRRICCVSIPSRSTRYCLCLHCKQHIPAPRTHSFVACTPLSPVDLSSYFSHWCSIRTLPLFFGSCEPHVAFS